MDTPHRRNYGAASLVIFGIVLRVLMALSPSGAFNSDEAITGLTANSVFRGEFPLIVPGNDYGGVLEAYVMAPFVLLFRTLGPVVWGARLLDGLNICLHIAMFALLYFAVKHLSSRRIAFFALLPIWILSAAYVRLASESYLGYVAGPAASIASVWLAAESENSTLGSRRSKRLLLSSAALAGIAFWQHPLAAIFPVCVLTFLTVALLFRAKSERLFMVRSVVVAVACFVAGAFPEIFRLIQRRNDLRLATSPNPQPFTTRFAYIFTEHLPRGLGLRMGNGDWLAPTMHLWVPVTLAIVIGLATTILALRGPRCLAALPLGLIVFAGSSATSFVNDGRYSIFVAPLLILLVATAIGRNQPKAALPNHRTTWRVASAIVSLLVVFGAWRSMHSSFTQFQLQSEREVINIVALLDEKNITSVRGDYWIVYRIGHITSERIASSDFVNKRIDRLEKRVSSSPPQQLAWISIESQTQPAEVVNNPDWPSTVIGRYRLYTYSPPPATVTP